MKNILLLPLLTFTLLFTSCSSDTTNTRQHPNRAQQLDSTTANDTITDSVTTPAKALNLIKHGHENVPSIAEKAHQNPVKTGRIQSSIRRGTPKKSKAMQNTMKKKQEAMEDMKQQR